MRSRYPSLPSSLRVPPSPRLLYCVLQIRGRSTYLEASLRQAIDHWLLMLHAGYNSSFVQRVRQWRNFARGKLKRLSRQESLKRLLVQHRTQVLERLKIEQSYLFEHYRDRKKVEVIEWSRMCTGPQWSGASTGAFAGTTPALAPFEWDESAKGAFFGPVPDLAAAEESSSHAAASGGAAFAVGGDGWSLAELAVYCDRDGVCGIALRVRLADTLVVHGIRSASSLALSRAPPFFRTLSPRARCRPRRRPRPRPHPHCRYRSRAPLLQPEPERSDERGEHERIQLPLRTGRSRGVRGRPRPPRRTRAQAAHLDKRRALLVMDEAADPRERRVDALVAAREIRCSLLAPRAASEEVRGGDGRGEEARFALTLALPAPAWWEGG